MINNIFVHFISSFAITSIGYMIGYFVGKNHEKTKNTIQKWRDELIDFPHGVKWECYFCNRFRIDALIGVVRYSSDPCVTYNLKHCKDNKYCIDKAHSITMLYGENVSLMKGE